MGRSVSSPCDAVWEVLMDYEPNAMYHKCTRCGHLHFNDDAPEQYDQEQSAWYWEDFTSDIKDTLTHAFPSLYPCDKWMGREDKAILQNGHVYIGISEYCGRVSIWFVAKDGRQTGYGWETLGLAERWARSIEKRAERLLKPLSHAPNDWAKAA